MPGESQPIIDLETDIPAPRSGQLRSRPLYLVRQVGPNFVRVPKQSPEPVPFLEPVVQIDLLPETIVEIQASQLTEQ